MSFENCLHVFYCEEQGLALLQLDSEGVIPVPLPQRMRGGIKPHQWLEIVVDAVSAYLSKVQVAADRLYELSALLVAIDSGLTIMLGDSRPGHGYAVVHTPPSEKARMRTPVCLERAGVFFPFDMPRLDGDGDDDGDALFRVTSCDGWLGLASHMTEHKSLLQICIIDPQILRRAAAVVAEKEKLVAVVDVVAPSAAPVSPASSSPPRLSAPMSPATRKRNQAVDARVCANRAGIEAAMQRGLESALKRQKPE